MQCRMLLVGPSLIAGSVLTLPPVVNADAQPQTITINTSQMRTGLAPRDFAFTLTGDGPVSAWKVVADPTATAEKAIAQTSADATAHRYLLAVYEPLAATSIEVSAHLKPVGGTVDQAGGIAVRFLTPDDYYVVRADVLEDDVRLYRVVNGKRQETKAPRRRSLLTSGTPSAFAPRQIALSFRSTANRSSPPRTKLSPDKETLRCGPKRTV